MAPETPPGGASIVRWLRRRADDVAVALIATMFVSFLLQIFFRYVLNRPLGWTEEVTVLCWVWVVLWGASFVVADAEEVRFDIVYNAVPAGARRVFTIVACLALVVLMALSLPATWRYVAFMRREHSAYLGMRFDVLYSIYVVFAVVCIVRQARVAWRAWRGRPPAAVAEVIGEHAA
ncbi:MAG TPA: TRAP transporter small permease [Caldimonas sp.]|jgi:TRAP-type C4-dicarboxylate transport system permease small subunit